MPITEEDRRRIQLKKEVTTTFILNKEDDVAFGGNKYLFKVEGDMDTGCIYYIDNITKNDVAFDNNSCLNLILLDTFDNGNYYDMNNPILLSFLENYSKSKCKRDVGISNEAIKQLNIDTTYTFTQIIQNIEDKKIKLKLIFHCHFLFNNYIIADKPEFEDRKKYEADFFGEKWDGYFIYYYKTHNKGFVNGELFHLCGLYTKTDGTAMERFKSIEYTGMPNLLDDNFYETIDISESDNTLNIYENSNLKTTYNNNNNHTMSNYNSNPYQDRNNYANNTEYKQEFYHKFSDPWKVRNGVEKNGHIVNDQGCVFSKEQVKEYKKWGVEITPDSNIHGNKTTNQLLKRK
jgi:hypothetical protein